MELTLKDRRKLTGVTAREYRKAAKREKTRILDTFIAQTGYGRKYAIHILANEGKTKQVEKGVRLKATHGKRKKREYPRVYDKEVLDALVPIWEAFNHQCGKLLAPFLLQNISCIASDKSFVLEPEVMAKLGKISASTIDRLLRPIKAKQKIKGTCGTKPAALHLKALIPTLSHYECKEQGPGLWQIDLVQHDGGNPAGEFCFTLTITEVKNAWTVHYALRNKAFRWVFQALDDALCTLPLPVLILHSDNGSEFINHALKKWCDQKGIALTRSRNDRKNDNCFVEQKNGASVRKIVGYARLSGDRGLAALKAVYSHYDNLLNFFYPCQKLLSKERVGKKIKKTYDKPQPPFNRVLATEDTPEELKKRLCSLKEQLDLMGEMRMMQKAIDKLPDLADPVPVFVSKRGMKPLRFGSQGSIS